MVNKELLEYIKSQSQQGVSKEKIRNDLLSSGWQPLDVDEGLSTSLIGGSQDSTGAPQTPQHMKKILISVSLVLVVVIAGVVVFAVQGKPKSIGKSVQVISITPTMSKQVTDTTISPTHAIVPSVIITATSSADMTTPSSTVQDCKQSLDCLKAASVGCQRAKVINTQTADMLGLTQSTVTYLEIKGLVGEDCNLYFRTLRVDLTIPTSVPQDIADKQIEVSKKLEGRDAECKFAQSDLTATLGRWASGTYDSGKVSCEMSPDGNVCKVEGGDFAAAKCQGTFFDSITP